MVELLYENGAKLYVDDLSVNPLFAAIYNNHIEVAKYLVEKGIDLHASYAMGDLQHTKEENIKPRKMQIK